MSCCHSYVFHCLCMWDLQHGSETGTSKHTHPKKYVEMFLVVLSVTVSGQD